MRFLFIIIALYAIHTLSASQVVPGAVLTKDNYDRWYAYWINHTKQIRKYTYPIRRLLTPKTGNGAVLLHIKNSQNTSEDNFNQVIKILELTGNQIQNSPLSNRSKNFIEPWKLIEREFKSPKHTDFLINEAAKQMSHAKGVIR